MGRTIFAIIAFAILAGFLGVLVWNVPRIDLAAVILFTLALAGYDFYRTFRESSGS